VPADLLEQQIEADHAFRQLAPNAVQENVPKKTDLKSLSAPEKTMWQKIFEGHEEFLGLTPD
jgi:hypothetical protein